MKLRLDWRGLVVGGVLSILAQLGDLPTKGNLWDVATGWDYTVTTLLSIFSH